MKITRRILVAVLALALFAASLAFMASAEENSPFTEPGIKEIEDILEFYEYDVYINNDLTNYDNEAATPVENTEDEVVASVGPLVDSSAGYQVALSESESKMVFEFSVRFGEGTVGNLSFDLKARLENENHILDSTFTSLFQVDMISPTPAFKYSVWDAEEGRFEADTVALAGITPAVDIWYDVALLFDAEEGTYSFTVAATDGVPVASPELSLGDKAGMTCFRLVGEFLNYTAEAINKSASFSTKNVEVYGGTFIRDIDRKEDITATTLTDLAELYKKAYADGDIETCVRIADVYQAYQALTNDDSLDDVIENIQDIESVDSVYNYSYAKALVLAVESINPQDTYGSRRAHIATIDRYSSFLPEDDVLFNPEGEYIAIVGVSEELANRVKEARVLLEGERATLDAIKANSVEFIKIILGEAEEIPEEGDPIAIPAYDAEWVNFDEEIRPYYDRLNALFAVSAEKPDLTYADETYDMADVVAEWADLEAKIAFADESAAEFKTYADIIKNTEARFGVRYYEGYIPATEFLVILSENEYFDVSTNSVINALIGVYNSYKEEMSSEAEKCETFLKTVKEASLATYYSVLVERLDSVAGIFDEVKEDYKGIPEAKEVYTKLREGTLKGEGNADDYITKVEEAKAVFTSDTSTFAQKQKALDDAIALKALGNVYGYEGVSEANIALSQMESELLFIEGRSQTLIALVAELADATTLSERRSIIRNATEVAKDSEATYEGVAAAKTALDAAVAAFNSEVTTANAALADATVNAAFVAAALSGNAGLYKTASIIQDYAK